MGCTLVPCLYRWAAARWRERNPEKVRAYNDARQAAYWARKAG